MLLALLIHKMSDHCIKCLLLRAVACNDLEKDQCNCHIMFGGHFLECVEFAESGEGSRGRYRCSCEIREMKIMEYVKGTRVYDRPRGYDIVLDDLVRGNKIGRLYFIQDFRNEFISYCFTHEEYLGFCNKNGF